MKTKRKSIPKIKKYDGGFFVDEQGDLNQNRLNSANQLAQLGAAGVSSMQPVNGDSNAGTSALSGALSGAGTGAKLGASFGPEGALIGGALGLGIGAVSGLISGGKKHRAYLEQQNQITQGNYFNNRNNMTTTNIDPYGSQMMAMGDFVLDGGPGDKVKNSKSIGYNSYSISTGGINFPAPGDPYWKTNPLMTEHSDGSFRLWGENPSVLDTRSLKQKLGNNALNELPSSTAPNTVIRGSGDGVNPNLIMQPNTPSPATIHSSSGYYEYGSTVGLSGKASGKFYTPNAGMRRFAPHMKNITKINPLATNTIKFEDGDAVMPTNSQQNMINIQKGELLINPEDGKILQEYKGINPLTGGMYENHSKDSSKESPNNFTLADPGLFVITKKTAKQYKDAVDNNDKISQKTVLMNIRNAKIAKDGGLQPKQFAYGDEIPGTPLDYYKNSNPLFPTLTLPNQAPSSNNVSVQNSNNLVQPTKLANPAYTYSPESGNGVGNALDTLSKYGPSIYNIGQGLFGNTNHQAHATPISNPYASQVIANMPKNVDMTSVRNDIYTNQDLVNKDLQNKTNSAGVYRANRQALGSNTDKALATARIQAQEINNQAAGQRSYMYNALGYQNQQEQQQERQYNLGVDDINARREAAKSNLLNAGLSQLQQTSMNDKQNAQKAGMDKYTLELLAQTFPNTKFYNQFQIDYINKLLGK